MKKRLHNPNIAKIHRNYAVVEVTSLYGVFKGNVRDWIKAGLPILNDKRPMFILGRDLVAFYQARRTKNKQKCKPGEIYCVRCRAPKQPTGDMVDYQIITDKIGNLKAICPHCDKIMSRRVRLTKLQLIPEKLNIMLLQALQHKSERYL